MKFSNLVSDEAKGILSGVKAAELNIPLCPDLFHLMQEGKRISQRLERRAYHALPKQNAPGVLSKKSKWSNAEREDG